ncbi:hypothetical protein BO85DRAFT_520670 [Aspergillus piperis CBS 112811]|uniref:F-box domain-containing protein n=1 Tax=Aspergillus piperis CBS 112811 TaxID=1448313 RepID=A0A8G1VKX5_9EURO|nr:hypothetical protein BO85DRAFT_520670 [Aspergillus piperis CBS 112811]RAH57214.1 hypothetical protein BO85DRAFT_520670 [Aspergillus piperis CBS 112811]
MANNQAVQEVNEADVLRAITYHRRDFELAVIRIRPSENEKVLPGIKDAFNRPFNPAKPGPLDYLPVEIFHKCLLGLDLKTLFGLRHVNARTRDIVSTFKPYQKVMVYAQDLYTLDDIFDVLHTRECTICGAEFGGFVLLLPPNLTRCCFPCVRTKSEVGIHVIDPITRRFSFERDYELITLAEAHNLYGVSPAVLRRENVPILKSLPGVYGLKEKERKMRHSLVHDKAVRELSTNHKRGLPWSDTSQRSGEMFLRWCMATIALPWVDPETGEIDRGVSCRGCQWRFEQVSSDERSFGSLSAPRDKVYSKYWFLVHFWGCTHANKLWKESKEGTVVVGDSEFVRRGGFIKDRKDDIALKVVARKSEP